MEFPEFPVQPYAVQSRFMTALYAACELGGVALLESPTGTGKTLSIICSALQWLEDERNRPQPAPPKPTAGSQLGLANAGTGASVA
ncbi:ATP-dependent RNA helicase chl1, partial [Haematococcus lacustris]